MVWSAYLCVNADHVSRLPDALQQLLQIPLVRSRDGHVVGHLVDDVQFLDCQLVDLVQNIDGGNVSPIALHISKHPSAHR
jgi:hypothetical protein